MSRTNYLNNAEDTAKSQNLLPPSDLESLVESYIINKQNEDKYKKIASAENTQIKELMTQHNVDEVTTDIGSATLSERSTTTFIEDSLIQFLKDNNLADGIVKTKEYVDYDALESAIYHDKISEEQKKEMAKCQETKTTLVLRISKKGKD